MGNTSSCPCSDSPKECVLIMRSDGSLLRCKKGVTAGEVTGSHIGHRVVRCSTKRAIDLHDATVLECKHLYFLMPADKVQCSDTYRKLWRVGESKGLLPPLKMASERKRTMAPTSEVCEGKRGVHWKPTLTTIEEGVSPSLSVGSSSMANVKSKAT